VPDIITLQSGGSIGPVSGGGDGELGFDGGADEDDGMPELDELKNYSPYVRARSHAAHTTNNGGRFLGGNTEERLKMRVLGTRQRGLPSEPPFNHTTGAGYVKATPLPGRKGAADYADAIVNRKARVHLLVHETSGAFSAYAARRLRRLGRAARALGIDGTDYATSYTASSFVSYYAQRITSACVLNGARGVFKALGQAKAKFAKSMTAAAAAAHEGA